MSARISDFVNWLRSHSEAGERLLLDDLGLAPTKAFYGYDSQEYVRNFYQRIDRWTSWRVALVGGLRRRLLEPEHLVTEAEVRFATERLLRFRMRFMDGAVMGIDLSDRDYFLDASGWTWIRMLFQRGRAEPEWDVVRNNLTADLRAFVALVEAQRADLVLVGEPRSPKLEEALQLLEARTYVNVGLVKTDLVAAESHFRAGHGKDVSAAFRRAVEQIVGDAYREAVASGLIPQPANTPDMHSQSDAVGKVLATRGAARQAYGAYSLLSELGSHAGPISAAELEAAWHSAVAGVFMLALRLKPST